MLFATIGTTMTTATPRFTAATSSSRMGRTLMAWFSR